MPTILFDLDNTLLGNEMDTFLPPYFAALERRLGSFISGQNLRPLMYSAAQTMQANQDPAQTNISVFMEALAAQLKTPLPDMQMAFEAFYHEDYPALQQVTTLRPEAAWITEYFLQHGYQIVIATNPLFPATAIEQRLVWAGLGDYSYALVTHMENSHFSKPNPRYYAEIAEKTRCDPPSTWMVGDDLKNDIAPAQSLGFKTWWIATATDQSEGAQPDEQGTLADFWGWVQAGNL